MTGRASTAERAEGSPRNTSGAGRFGTRAALAWVALVAAGVPFLLLWAEITGSPSSVAAFDEDVVVRLNDLVNRWPTAVSVLRVVTDLGGTLAGTVVFSLTSAFLFLRRQRRLAWFVVVTSAGLGVLIVVAKALVDRARPVLDTPVVSTPSDASFPSGHAMTALGAWGLLLLVSLPGVRRAARPWLVAGTALLVLLIGASRVALGVHYPSDVVAGWLLAAGWLVAMTAVFRGWQHDARPALDEPWDPLEVAPRSMPALAPGHERVLPRGRRSVVELLAGAVTVFIVLAGLGLLATDLVEAVGSWDRSVVRDVINVRGPLRTDVVETVSLLSGTPAVVVGILSLSTLGLAVAGNWRPVAFVVVTVVGEAALYLAVSEVVNRPRPPVTDLTAGLPQGASWPSGHVAAAVALYGAAAVLFGTYSAARWRWAALVLPVLVAPAVAASRVYEAAHYPTDVLAGLLLGGAWLTITTFVLLRSRPLDGQGRVDGAEDRSTR